MPSILICDRDFEFAENIKLFLEDTYLVKIIQDFSKIMDEFKKTKYDFIITELPTEFQELDVIIGKIRNQSPISKIILMCTFFDTDVNSERLINKKVDDCIFKPFNVDLLKHKLDKLQRSKKIVSYYKLKTNFEHNY